MQGVLNVGHSVVRPGVAEIERGNHFANYNFHVTSMKVGVHRQ